MRLTHTTSMKGALFLTDRFLASLPRFLIGTLNIRIRPNSLRINHLKISNRYNLGLPIPIREPDPK
jgi:hypothetical protein